MPERPIDFSAMYIKYYPIGVGLDVDNRIGFKSSSVDILIIAGNLTQRFNIGCMDEMKNGFRMAAIIFIGRIRLIYHIIR